LGRERQRSPVGLAALEDAGSARRPAVSARAGG
jgi:hypothetical protein